MQEFFKHILGLQGWRVLESLSKSSENIASYLTPRIVVSWLRQEDYGQLQVPQGCPLQKLAKSGYGYSGATNIGGLDYNFENVAEEHIAAIITVASGQEIQQTETKDIDLAKLAKTIDLLVKAQKIQYERTQNAQYLEPEQPIEPEATQPKQTTKPALPKVPQIPKITRKRKLTVQKSEAQKPCQLCGKKMFTNTQFTGCTCFSPLAKSVSTASSPLSYTLTFSEDIDEDALLALIGALKHDGK